MYGFDSVQIGIGTEIPNAWAFDTAQFDSILKKLKVVFSVSYLSYCVYSICSIPYHDFWLNFVVLNFGSKQLKLRRMKVWLWKRIFDHAFEFE